jgi:uncharacterized protein (DUF2384 family)
MTIKTLSQKLRFAADALDALFEIPGTPAMAAKIVGKTTWKRRKVVKKRTSFSVSRRRSLAMKASWAKRRMEKRANA